MNQVDTKWMVFLYIYICLLFPDMNKDSYQNMDYTYLFGSSISEKTGHEFISDSNINQILLIM